MTMKNGAIALTGSACLEKVRALLLELHPNGADLVLMIGLEVLLWTAYGLIPAPENSARAAMLELFFNWQCERSADASEDAAIKELVLEFITRHGEAYFSELGQDGPPIRDRAGWWRKDGERRVWLFTTEGLRRAVPGFELNTILAVLDGAAWITDKGDGGKRAKKVRVGGQPLRLYHLQPLEG